MKQFTRTMLRMLVLLIIPVYFYSCSDDEKKDEILIPKADGFYIFGSNTIASSPSDPAARMTLAVLDADYGNKVPSQDSVFGKFLYIGENSTIEFVNVVNKEGTVFGAADGGTVENGVDFGFSVNDDVIHGNLEAGEDKIKVAEEGFYYAFVDLNTGLFVIMPAGKLNMIGAATPERSWSEPTYLSQVFLSKDSVIFEETGLDMLGGDTGYKYRFNDGWQAYTDGSLITLTSLGEKDYGLAWENGFNDVGQYQSNIPQKETGLYTVRVKYTAATNIWKETKVKSYATTEVAIIGDATADGSFAGNGTGGYEQKTPTRNGNIYTWTWDNVPFIAEKEFIFLENATWGAGLQVAFLEATVTGTAVSGSKIVDATTAGKEFHNFYVAAGAGAAYDVTLTVNAATGQKTVTINNN